MSSHEITFNPNPPEAIRTRADFTYKITPTVILITDTGLGRCSEANDIEAVLREIEYWHQGSIGTFKIMCRDGKGFWHGVQWDGKTASFFFVRRNRRAKGLRETAWLMSKSHP